MTLIGLIHANGTPPGTVEGFCIRDLSSAFCFLVRVSATCMGEVLCCQ